MFLNTHNYDSIVYAGMLCKLVQIWSLLLATPGKGLGGFLAPVSNGGGWLGLNVFAVGLRGFLPLLAF